MIISIFVILWAFLCVTNGFRCPNLYSQRQIFCKKYMMGENEASPQPEIITIGALTAISGPLGVLLDNQHGMFDVLEYHSLNMNFFIGDTVVVKSAYWVPVLFAFAGFAMSILQLLFDKTLEGRKGVIWPYCFVWHICFQCPVLLIWLAGSSRDRPLGHQPRVVGHGYCRIHIF